MAKGTKKLGEGQEMDLEQLRRAYIQDFGPCDNCGSEDLDFSIVGNDNKVKCKECGAEWELTGILDDKIKKGEIVIIDKDTEVVIKLLEEWAASFSNPDEPVLFVPDGYTGEVSARRLLDEIKRGTPFGKGQLASMVETYKELGLSVIVPNLKKGRKPATMPVLAPIISDHEENIKGILEHWKKTIGEENVKKYQGKYVGIINENEIVASGNHPDEIMEEIKKKNLPPVLITFIPK